MRLMQSTADRSHPTAVRMLSADLDGISPRPAASAAARQPAATARAAQPPDRCVPAAAGGNSTGASMGAPVTGGAPPSPHLVLRGGAGASCASEGELGPPLNAPESLHTVRMAYSSELPFNTGSAVTSGVAISPFAAVANARQRFNAASGSFPVLSVRQDGASSTLVTGGDPKERADGAAGGAPASEPADVHGAAARKAANGGELAQSGAFLAVGSYVAGLRRVSQVSVPFVSYDND